MQATPAGEANTDEQPEESVCAAPSLPFLRKRSVVCNLEWGSFLNGEVETGLWSPKSCSLEPVVRNSKS